MRVGPVTSSLSNEVTLFAASKTAKRKVRCKITSQAVPCDASALTESRLYFRVSRYDCHPVKSDMSTETPKEPILCAFIRFVINVGQRRKITHHIAPLILLETETPAGRSTEGRQSLRKCRSNQSRTTLPQRVDPICQLADGACREFLLERKVCRN